MTPQEDAPVRGRPLIVAVVLLVLLCAFVWMVRGVVTPFVVAFAAAAMFDPLLRNLQKRGIPRWMTIIGMYILLFLLLGLFLNWFVPIVVNEASLLAKKWPVYYQEILKVWDSLVRHPIVRRFHIPVPQNIAVVSEQAVDYLNRQWPKALGNAVGGLFGTFGFILNFVVFLIAAFYLMNDWVRLKCRVQYLIPSQYRENVLDVFERVGAVFIAYLRGLLSLCLLYGTIVTVELLALNVSYAFILGLVAALLYAVPYVGATTLGLVSGIVAYVGTGSPMSAFIVVVVLLVTNQLFDNLLTPRVLGRSTGIHPLLSLFAIIAGAHLLGFIGFIVGVPIAASIAVIAAALYPRLAEPIPESIVAEVTGQGEHPSEKPDSAEEMQRTESDSKIDPGNVNPGGEPENG